MRLLLIFQELDGKGSYLTIKGCLNVQSPERTRGKLKTRVVNEEGDQFASQPPKGQVFAVIVHNVDDILCLLRFIHGPVYREQDMSRSVGI